MEIRVLMALMRSYLRRELAEMRDNQIALKAIGNLKQLPERVRRELEQTIAATAEGAQMDLTLALSYGGRSEIVQAVQDPGPGAGGRTPQARGHRRRPVLPATSTPPTCPTRTCSSAPAASTA